MCEKGTYRCAWIYTFLWDVWATSNDTYFTINTSSSLALLCISLSMYTHTHTYTGQAAYLSDPFALGQAFLSSVFDSLTTVAFHNPGINDLLQLLLGTKPSSKIMQISIESTKYTRFSGLEYKELYRHMTTENVLCLGIHRQRNEGSHQRFIITAPPHHLTLLQHDVVLAVSLSCELESLLSNI